MKQQLLKRLVGALNDKTQLEGIGRKIIEDRLRHVSEVENGKKPERFAVALVFKKGDLIPESFRGLPNMKLDPDGVLLEDWEDSWCQGGWSEAGGWDDAWGECWDNSGPSELEGGKHFGDKVDWVTKVVPDFTPAERIVLKNFGIQR